MPADESPFDLPTAAALVRLRVFLEDARRRAQDLSDPGRHLGLIALDGVVEYALWLVAQTIQAPLKRERPSFGELQTAVTNRLREEGREWQVAGRAGVDQLRRARNEAQHAAVAPAVEQMPRWADSAHAYIESLLVAAFSLRVSDIVLAIAVRDEPLRTRLAQAEAAIEIGESEFGFSYAYIAFEEARSRWRSQRLGGLVPEPDVMTFPDSTASLRARVGQLEDLLEVQAFTSDLGEYVSLLHSRRQQEIGWQPEPEDARRALVFAVGWIVRWEVFTSGYPAERWAEWEKSIEPPTTADGKPGTVVSADATLVRTQSAKQYYSLHVRVANLPDRGRGDWGADIGQCWTKAAAELELDLHPASLGLGLAGTLHALLPLGSDADAAAAVVHRAIALADESYRQRVIERDARERRRAEAEHELGELFAATAPGSELFDGVEVRAEVDERGERLIATIQLLSDQPYVELPLVADLFRNVGGPLAGAMLSDAALVFDAFPLDEAGSATLTGAITSAESEIARRRAIDEKVNEEYRSFAMRFQELLASE